jgi:Methyltransferase domain
VQINIAGFTKRYEDTSPSAVRCWTGAVAMVIFLMPFPGSVNKASGRSFEAVISASVLEHVRETGGNEEANLREIFRILKPGELCRQTGYELLEMQRYGALPRNTWNELS